jgi:hypothetical protein
MKHLEIQESVDNIHIQIFFQFEEFCLLGYNIVQSVRKSFDVSEEYAAPSSGPKNKPSMKPPCRQALLAISFHAGFLLGLFFDLDDRADIFLRNVG